MTIVYDPGLGMEAANCEIGGGTTPFMAPELLLPSKFGLYKCIPSKEADIYAIGMVIYQVRVAQRPALAYVDSFRIGAHWNITIREIVWV